MNSDFRLLLRAALAAMIAAVAAPAWACSGRLHIETGTTAVYQLDHAAIVAAVPELDGCPVEQLRLSNRGVEVPLQVLDDGDGVLGNGDRLVWIGRTLHGSESWADAFSLVNVYELDAAPGERLRFASRTVDPAQASSRAVLGRRLHLEEDSMMIRLRSTQVEPGSEPDVWYWAKMTMVDPQPFAASFDLPGIDPHAGDVGMKLAFRGLSLIRVPADEEALPDHRVEVTLNNRRLPDIAWDGEDHFVATVDVPHGLLREEGNQLALAVPARTPAWAVNPAVDVVMLDYIDLDVPLRATPHATADPIQVRQAGETRLAGNDAPLLLGSDGGLYQPDTAAGEARYAPAAAGTELFPLGAAQPPRLPSGLRPVAVAPDWRNPQAAYDYVIISHPTLMEAIEPLAEFHRRRGLRTAVISVDAAYDQFNHGIVNPGAIRDLLAHAWKSWPAPKPRYALLVGDASFDIHDTASNDLLYAKWINMELLTPGQFGEIPATPYQDAPQSAASRNLIPTFQYFSWEGQSASDNAFVAFGDDDLHPVIAIGRFPVVSPEEVTMIVDKTINYVENPRMGSWRQSVMFITNEDQSFQRISDTLADELGEQGFSASKIYPRSEEADNVAHQQRIRDDLDDGQLLVHFLGHGGRYIWRTGPPDPLKNHDLFTLDDIGALENAGKLPMVLSMTCYSAPFDNPTEDSIGEKFLREADKGAIAVFAASWRNNPNIDFSKDLMQELIRPGQAIGDAILRAKRATKSADMIAMYNLLGDPAIALQRPQEQLQMAWLDKRWSPEVVVRVPEATSFNGRMRVAWLDAESVVLEEKTYTVSTPLVRLPAAPAGADRVRIYALDPERAADAIGELSLAPAPAVKPVRRWWQPRPRPRPLPPAEDRIHGDTFED